MLAFAQMRVLGFGNRLGELAGHLTNLDVLLAPYPTDAGPHINALRCGVDGAWSFLLATRGDSDGQANAKAAQAIQWLPLSVMRQHPNVESVRGRAALQYAMSEQVLGRGASVRAWIENELRQAGDGHPVYTARVLMSRAHVELSSGLLTQLAHTARQLVGITTEHRLDNDGAWGRLFAAHVAYEWNDLETARQLCVDGLALRDNAFAGCVLSLTLRLALTLLALGSPDEARRLALDALELAEKTNRLGAIESLRSFEARLALASGDLDAAAHWIESIPLTSRPAQTYNLEEPRLTRFRVLLATDTEASLASAATVVDNALAIAEARHMLPRIVEALALRALVEQARGEIDAAFRTLTRAVTGCAGPVHADLPGPRPADGWPAGHARPPQRRPLGAGYRQAPGDGRSRGRAAGQPALPCRELALPDDVEPLTWRELEILHQLAARHTNKEIAETLCISWETVKRHAANIYSKLQVSGRVEAVARARQLGLLREFPTPATRR